MIKTICLILGVIAIIGRFYGTYKVAVADILLNPNPKSIVYFDYALAIGGLTIPLIMKAMSEKRHGESLQIHVNQISRLSHL